MAQEREKMMALKTRVKELEVKVEQQSELITQFQAIGNAADEKIKALNSIHSDKIRSLMNSIQLLKKENKNLEKLTKEASRSALIEQLNKDIQDQEIVIEALRKCIPDEKADGAIVDALNKGPPKVRAPTREELKIEVKKLKALAQQAGNGGNKKGDISTGSVKQGDASQNKITQGDEQKNNESLNKSTLSDIENQKQDQSENLIRRFEEIKNENDELKLNLRAEQEIVEKYEEELVKKSSELNELRSAKTDFIVLTKKYETIQNEFNLFKQDIHKKATKDIDKEQKMQALEIANKQQQQKLRSAEDHMRSEMESMQFKVDDYNNKYNLILKEHELQVVKNTDLQKRYNELDKKHAGLLVDNKQYKDDLSKAQNLIKKLQITQETQSSELKRQLEEKQKELDKTNEDLREANVKLQRLEQEMEHIKMRLPEGVSLTQSYVVGAGQQSAIPTLETKQYREKIKQLTKREIELQDRVEQLQQEMQFKEQKDKAQAYLNKRNISSNINQEELKRKYMKEVQERYERKVTKLVLRVRELENRNQELQEIHQMLEDKAELALGDISSVGSEVSVSLKSLQSVVHPQGDADKMSEISDISQIQKTQEKIIEEDKANLKKKLVELTRKEIDLQNQVDQLQAEKDLLERQGGKTVQKATNDEEFEKKIKNMQKDYEAIIKDLSDKIAGLEMKDVQLSKISSNIGSLISQQDQQQIEGEEAKNLDSNISFSLADINSQCGRKEKEQTQQTKGQKPDKKKTYNKQEDKEEVQSISQINSNVESILQSEDKEEMANEINEMSSGISNISDLKDN